MGCAWVGRRTRSDQLLCSLYKTASAPKTRAAMLIATTAYTSVEITTTTVTPREACPSDRSRAKRTMLTSGVTTSGPARFSPGIIASSPGAKDASINGIRYACASLKLRAKLVSAKSTAEKNAANSISRKNNCTTRPSVTGPLNTKLVSWFRSSVMSIMARLIVAVSIATVTTATYLARSRAMRGTGADTRISRVPRSRSPAVRSMAG